MSDTGTDVTRISIPNFDSLTHPTIRGVGWVKVLLDGGYTSVGGSDRRQQVRWALAEGMKGIGAMRRMPL
jgi:hypothetical protein